MVPLSHFYLPLMDILLLTCVASMQPHPIYRTALLSPYTHLGSSAMNTAWSVHCILIYLNDNISCTFLNLNLLDSPLSLGSLRVSTLLLSACSLVNLHLELPTQPIVARSCRGSPRHPSFLKTPFKKPLPQSLFKSTFASFRVKHNTLEAQTRKHLIMQLC